MGRIVIDYIWLTVAISLLLAALAYMFPALGSSSSMITTMIAAMTAGQFYGGRTAQEASSGFAWKVAGILTLVSLVLGAIVLAAFHFAGLPLLPEGTDIGAGAWILIIGISSLVVFLITRFFFRMGVKMGAKTAALKKDKAEIFD